MADINSITQGASYRGDPGLGGARTTGVTIDPTPLERLATFSFYRDRDLWNKKNEDDKAAAEKIAKLTAFDVTSPLKPFADDLKAGLFKLQDYIRENPDSLNFSKSPDKYIERERMINELETKRRSATASDALYNSGKDAIEKIQDPKIRELRRRELMNTVDGFFKGGLENAYNNRLNPLPELKKEDWQLPKLSPTVRSFVQQLPNSDVTTEVTYVDWDAAKRDAALAVAKRQDQIDVNSESFKNLSQKEQELELEKQTLLAEPRARVKKLAGDLKGLFDQWQAANPNINIDTVNPDSLPDGTLEDNVRSILLLNKELDEMNQYVLEGKIKDPSGRVRTKPYDKININDGISEDEVALLQMFQESGGSLIKKVDKKITGNDNAIQLEKIRADKALGWAGLQWDKDKFALQLKGPDETKNAAVVFAENLVKGIASKGSIQGNNGTVVLTAKDIRGLTADQLKWLGQELPEAKDKFGKVTRTAGLHPLTVADDEVMEIRQDGTILIMSKAKFIPKENKYEGKWDNTRSTTVGNVARLVLNEENAKAGTKELNPYVPVDIGTREAVINVNQSGGSTTVTGSTSTGGRAPVTGTFTIKDASGKVIATDYTPAEAQNAQKKGYTIEQNK